MHDFPYKHHHEITDSDFDGCCGACAQSLAIIKEHLLRFHQTLTALPPGGLEAMTAPELYQFFLSLDDIAHLHVEDALAASALGDPDVLPILEAVRKSYTLFFDLHEKALAHAILAADDPWAVLQGYFLLPRYEALIQSQLRLTGGGGERPVFVGCGPLPVTLILLQRHGMAPVGLDCDPEAVRLAGKVLEKLGVGDGVDVLYGDETAVADMRCDSVLIAALAEPKERIFSNLVRLLDGKDVMIFYRTYTGMREILHPPAPKDALHGFAEVGRAAPTGRVNNTLVCMRTT